MPGCRNSYRPFSREQFRCCTDDSASSLFFQRPSHRPVTSAGEGEGHIKMPSTEACLRLDVLDPAGLHLRRAARFARIASRFEADIRVAHQESAANAKSVLELLLLVRDTVRNSRCKREARTQSRLWRPLNAWPQSGPEWRSTTMLFDTESSVT